MQTHNDSVEFMGMQEFSVLFGESMSLNCLASRVKGRLGQGEEVDVSFEGRIDVGSSNGPCIKMMAPIGSESEWEAYIKIVMESEVRVIDMVVQKVVESSFSDGNEFDVYSSPMSVELGQPLK